MMKSSRCIIYMSGQTRCLVINEGSVKQAAYRLPTLQEVSQNFLEQHTLLQIGKLIVIRTAEEIAPWDLLDPFPPPNYYDYDFLELNNIKKNSSIWNCFKREDKEEITVALPTIKEKVNNEL